MSVFLRRCLHYKKGVRERSRFLVDYFIDKVDFLEIYQSARKEAFRESNISKAWMVVGLEPFDPNVILKQLPGYTLAIPLHRNFKVGRSVRLDLVRPT
jgi:hypothetical protein